MRTTQRRHFNPLQQLRAMAVFALAGCSDPAGLEKERVLAEQHPPAADVAVWHGPPRWAPDGMSLYYLTQSHVATRLNVETGAKNILTTVSPPSQILEVEAGASGSEWYTLEVELPANRVILRHHSEGAATMITDRALSNVGGSSMRRAANGDLAYIVRPDSVFVWRSSTRQSHFLAAACSGLSSVAPAGDGVICFPSQTTGGLGLVRVTAGTPPTSFQSADGLTRDAAWTAAGIHLVFSTAFSFRYEKYLDPASKFQTPEYRYPEDLSWQAVLAPDGRSFAFANSWCARSGGLFSCDLTQTLFYVSDVTTRSTRRIGVHTGYNPKLALSPDGSRLAYVMDGNLYIMGTK